MQLLEHLSGGKKKKRGGRDDGGEWGEEKLHKTISTLQESYLETTFVTGQIALNYKANLSRKIVFTLKDILCDFWAYMPKRVGFSFRKNK